MFTAFRGVGVALVTPFTQDAVDYEVLEKLVERQVRAGIDALIVLGTTGEPSTMTDLEKEQVARFVVARAAGRVPVIAGVGANSTARAREIAKMLASTGADALLAVTPYYNKATQQGLIAHYGHLANATELPLILYNVPGRTGLNMLPETVQALAGHAKIVGLKEASESIGQLAEDVRLCPGLRVYSGNDDMLLPALAVGASGIISVAANIVPAQVKQVTDRFFAGDMAGARVASQRLSVLNRLLFSEVSPIPCKAALRLMGYGTGTLRLPLTDMQPGGVAALRAELEKLDLVR
ncbi:MAG: 4-hydroxy-tetrahydrodipicolinate synthase [Clostridia bacterium]